MPSCLSELLTYNTEHNITMTPSEINKTVRRMNKLREVQEAERLRVEAERFVMGHSDETGEIACGFKENPFTNTDNAARRIGVAA
jgi:hypothetical protein